MIEPSGPVPSAGLVASASNTSHAGTVIREAREARGHTTLHLSILLKITERRLQAFEEGRWADVGDSTFVRALAQRLCKHLGLDPQPVLQSLPAVTVQPYAQADRGRLKDAAAPSLKSLRRRVHKPGGGGAGLVTPIRAGVAVILAGALGLAYLPSDWSASAPTKESTVGEEPMATPPSAAPTSVVPGVMPRPASEPVAGAVPGGPSTPQAVQHMSASPAGAVAPQLVLPNSAGAADSGNPTHSSALDPATSPLQLRATQDTWVQVTDSRGTLVISRLLRMGERVGLDGVRPLRLRVGNVSGTEVVWQGRRVAIEDSQRNNVADVELP
jgi:cytoskeleton protein RodZ